MTDNGTAELTPSELTLAAIVGALRFVRAIVNDRPETHGSSRYGAWTRHIEGAAGEMLYAKIINSYWTGMNGKVCHGDIGIVEVRTTHWKDGRLIVHPEDEDNAPFILAVGLAPKFRFAGWLFGKEAKRDEWWDDPKGEDRAAYFAPQSALRPMHTLTDAYAHQVGAGVAQPPAR